MNGDYIFPLLAINNIYPFINLDSHIKFLENKYLHKQYTSHQQSFGAFVTVERELQKLDSFPNEVHGCHGDYEYNFKTITVKSLLQRVIKLGSSTAFTDDRRNYFPPLLLDYLANVKVSVMLKPVYPVSNDGFVSLLKHDSLTMHMPISNKTKKRKHSIKKITTKTTKTKFTNDKFGLIVLDNNNQRATYLPHVFPASMTWDKLSNSLKRKASITTDTNNMISYKAYKTDEISMQLHKFFSNEILLALRYLEIVLALKFNEQGIPIYSIQNDTNIYSSDDIVRNCGICSDVIKAIYYIKRYAPELYLKKKVVITKTISKCERYLLSIYKLYNTNEETRKQYRQATSFVIIGLLYLEKHSQYKKQINQYCSNILENIADLEIRFELGECLVAVNTAISMKAYKISSQSLTKKQIQTQKHAQQQQIKTIINNIVSESLLGDLNDIFTINWLIQALCVSLTFTNYYMDVLNILISKLVSLFANYYNKAIISSANNNNHKLDESVLVLETNYLAVAYEAVLNCITYLYNTKKTSSSSKQSITDTSILDILVKLSVALINRKCDKTGLYKFKDGSIRYDISGHTIVI